jgi:hypothetical protein
VVTQDEAAMMWELLPQNIKSEIVGEFGILSKPLYVYMAMTHDLSELGENRLEQAREKLSKK